MHSIPPQPPAKTRLSVRRRFTATQQAATTQPLAFGRTQATQRATLIQPTVVPRSIETQPAPSTGLSVLMPLWSNTTGINNTAIGGINALFNNTTGNNNIAVGFQAGINLTTGNNNIDVGNAGVAGETNTIRMGTAGTQTKTFVAGINGAAVTGAAVKVNAAGQLGTAPSSQRYKDAIKPMDKASEAILGLKPVTFHYKKGLDPEGIPQFGL